MIMRLRNRDVSGLGWPIRVTWMWTRRRYLLEPRGPQLICSRPKDQLGPCNVDGKSDTPRQRNLAIAATRNDHHNLMVTSLQKQCIPSEKRCRESSLGKEHRLRTHRIEHIGSRTDNSVSVRMTIMAYVVERETRGQRRFTI